MDCRVKPGNDRAIVEPSSPEPHAHERLPPRMASPEFWRNGGYTLVALGMIGVVAVMLFADHKRRLRKRLALLFVAVLLAGLALRASASPRCCRRRASARTSRARVGKIKDARMLTPEAQRRVAAKLQRFAGQEFAGQVAPGSDDARPLWRRSPRR